MKKILFITPFVPGKHGGGGAAYTEQLVNELANNCLIELFYFRYKTNEPYKPCSKNVHVIGERIITLKDKLIGFLNLPYIFPLFTSRYKRCICKFLQNKIDEMNYDYVYLDFGQTFAYGKFLNHPNKIYMAHDVIGQKYYRSRKYLAHWARWSENYILQYGDAIFTFSEKDCRLIKEWYGMTAQSTTFFLSKDVFNAQPTASEKYYVMYGSWGRVENHGPLSWFIDNVLPLLSNSVRIKIVGGGKIPEKLKNKISELVQIEYIGFVENPYPYLAGAIAEIAPLVRGAGVKVKCVEALACGTPIIGTELAFEGIPSEYSEFMFLAKTPEDYAKTMSEINKSIAERNSFKKRFCKDYNNKSILRYIYQ